MGSIRKRLPRRAKRRKERLPLPPDTQLAHNGVTKMISSSMGDAKGTSSAPRRRHNFNFLIDTTYDSEGERQTSAAPVIHTTLQCSIYLGDVETAHVTMSWIYAWATMAGRAWVRRFDHQGQSDSTYTR